MLLENTKKINDSKDVLHNESIFRDNIIFWKKELNNNKGSLAEKEKKAFTVEGRELSEKEKIGREYVKLTAILAFDSDLETDEYSDVNKMLHNLGDYIIDLEDDPIMYDVIKKLIVYLDMQIGCKLSFYSTFNEMLLSGELEYDYHELKDKMLYNFKSLITFFYDKIYNKMYGKEDYKISSNSKDKLKVEEWLNEKRISKIVSSLARTKELDVQKYYNLSDILNQILAMMYDDTLSEKKILFARKVLTYLEYSLGIEIVDSDTIRMPSMKKELKSLNEKTIFNEDIDMDCLKEKFHYDDGSLRKRKG